MRIKLIAFNGRYIHSCLALFYVREELRRALPEAEIELRQYTINDPYYPTLLKISDQSPAVVMFSVYIWNSAVVLRLLTDLVVILPATHFVLGGPQAASLDLEGLPPRVSTVLGAVEGLPPQFYQGLRQGQLAPRYQAVSGLPFPSPYRDDDLSGELAHRQVYYESTRGCPFACSYCLSSVERGMVWKEVSEVERELTTILAHQPGIIKFVDRTFNARPDRALAIWRFLARHAGATVCHFEMAPDLFNEEMFAFLATLPPGIFQFELGIQSTNPATLRRVNRQMAVELATENIKRLVELGTIHLHADLIVGLPGETAAEVMSSLAAVFAMGPHHIQMGLLKVLPHTAISLEPGLTHASAPPYEVLATDGLDHGSLAELYWLGECVEAFYNNRYFPSFFGWLRASKTDFPAFACQLLALCQQRDFFNRATTQEQLTELLLASTADWPEASLIGELLRYDWLRCGHRYLPQALGQTASVNTLRDTLSRRLPPNLPPWYTYQNRSEFLRKSMFMEFSAPALQALDLGEGGPGLVGFLSEKTSTLDHLQEVIVLPTKHLVP